MDQPIANDFNHLHFGAGQTEAKITLPLGKHTLRLLFADFAHVPHNPPVYSDAINVTVTESGRPPKKRYKRHRRFRYDAATDERLGPAKGGSIGSPRAGSDDD